MKKILRVEVEKVPVTTYTYKYKYEDNKGFVVKVEGLGSIEDVKRDISKKIKKLSNESYKIVNVKKRLII